MDATAAAEGTPAPIEHSPTPLEGDQSSKAPASNAQQNLDTWKQAATGDNAPQTSSVSAPGKVEGDQQPVYQAPPVVITPVQRPGILGIVDKMADVLAGKTSPEIATDQNGNKYVKETTMSRGEQWMRIAGRGIVGAAAGASAGRGGNVGGAAEAGVQAGQKVDQQQRQNFKDLTAEARQQNLDNANNQMLRMNMLEQSWRFARLQQEAGQHDTEFNQRMQTFAQGQIDRFTKDGGTVIGSAAHPWDIGGILKENPSTVADMIQHHLIETVQNYDADGKPAGVTIVKMPDGYGKTLLPQGSVFHTWDPLKHEIVEHHASDPMTARERDDYEAAAASAALKFQSDKLEQDKKAQEIAASKATASEAPSKIELNKAEAAKNYAEAHKATEEAKVLNAATSAADIESNAGQMVEGQIDPSQLSKRAKTYDAQIAAANRYSMQHYGVPFDLAKAQADYKFATNVGTFNTMNYLNSLTGHDDKGGNLAQLVAMSDKLPRGDYPPLNAVEQWAKLAAGNPQIAAYRGVLLEVQDQIAKILQGGGQGGSSTSDAKIRQAGEVLNKNFSAAQIKETANDLRPLLANRKREMIGTNRYLLQWNGLASRPTQQQQAAQRPERPQGVPATYLFVKTTPQDPGQWLDPAKLLDAKKVAPQLQVIQ